MRPLRRAKFAAANRLARDANRASRLSVALAAALLFFVPPRAFAQQPDSTHSLMRAACGASDVQFSVKMADPGKSIPAPAPPQSLVYVVEYYNLENDILTATLRVGLDGAWVGANHGHSYLAFSVPPGEHHLCVNWQSHLVFLSRLVSLANLNAESGKIYYFRSRIISQGKDEPPLLDLTRVDADEGNCWWPHLG